MTRTEIAKVCHEANRAYCAALGDMSQSPWEEAPAWQRDSACNGVALHLDNPTLGDSHSHEAWMSEKEADGWTYGSVKDPAKKEHPCMVPFKELPAEQQAKDTLFRSIVHALAQVAE